MQPSPSTEPERLTADDCYERGQDTSENLNRKPQPPGLKETTGAAHAAGPKATFDNQVDAAADHHPEKEVAPGQLREEARDVVEANTELDRTTRTADAVATKLLRLANTLKRQHEWLRAYWWLRYGVEHHRVLTVLVLIMLLGETIFLAGAAGVAGIEPGFLSWVFGAVITLATTVLCWFLIHTYAEAVFRRRQSTDDGHQSKPGGDNTRWQITPLMVALLVGTLLLAASAAGPTYMRELNARNEEEARSVQEQQQQQQNDEQGPDAPEPAAPADVPSTNWVLFLSMYGLALVFYTAAGLTEYLRNNPVTKRTREITKEADDTEAIGIDAQSDMADCRGSLNVGLSNFLETRHGRHHLSQARATGAQLEGLGVADGHRFGRAPSEEAGLEDGAPVTDKMLAHGLIAPTNLSTFESPSHDGEYQGLFDLCRQTARRATEAEARIRHGLQQLAEARACEFPELPEPSDASPKVTISEAEEEDEEDHAAPQLPPTAGEVAAPKSHPVGPNGAVPAGADS